MTISQKRAIGYHMREKAYMDNIAYLKKIGKYEDFRNSKYKYATNYIKYVVNKAV